MVCNVVVEKEVGASEHLPCSIQSLSGCIIMLAGLVPFV